MSGKFFYVNAPTYFQQDVVRHTVSYNEDTGQCLDIYTKGNPVDCPVLVFFHGGDWTNGNRSQYRFFAMTMAERGYVCVVPDFRLSSAHPFPTNLEDGAKALKWVHENIQVYGGDANCVFLSGHCSGAYLAAMLLANRTYLWRAGIRGDDFVQGLVGLSGQYCQTPDAPEVKSKKIFPDKYSADMVKASTFVDGHEPPIFLAWGEKDTDVSRQHMDEMQKAIQKGKGLYEIKTYPHHTHESILADFAWMRKGTSQIVADVCAFLSEQVNRYKSGVRTKQHLFWN